MKYLMVCHLSAELGVIKDLAGTGREAVERVTRLEGVVGAVVPVLSEVIAGRGSSRGARAAATAAVVEEPESA